METLETLETLETPACQRRLRTGGHGGLDKYADSAFLGALLHTALARNLQRRRDHPCSSRIIH